MKIHIHMAIICLVLLISTNTLQISLPVKQQTLIKVSLSIRRLQELLKNFGTRYENKFQLFKRVELTKNYLFLIQQELSRYNNVIAGQSNNIKGSKNIIIGNYNNIQGSNNWVFISKYTGKINGDLLISEWRVQLDKANLILVNPRLAISFLDENKNKKLQKDIIKQKRRLCRWDSFKKTNQKYDSLWEKYQGYAQFKNQKHSSSRTKHLTKHQEDSSHSKRHQGDKYYNKTQRQNRQKYSGNNQSYLQKERSSSRRINMQYRKTANRVEMNSNKSSQQKSQKSQRSINKSVKKNNYKPYNY